MSSAVGKFWQEHGVQTDLILQSLFEGVCIIDAERRIVYVNDSAVEKFGAKSAELLEKYYDLVFFQRDKSLSETDLAVCPVQFALTEGAVSHVRDEFFFRADGHAFAVEYVCTPIVENDRIIGAIVSFEDISERRQIERAIAEARDAAIEAVRTKTAFLANISHEIRTPLSGIVGLTQLMGETRLSSEQQKYVEMLQKSVASLMEIVNDILDFSKIEAGKMRLDAIDFNLEKLLAEIVGLYRSTAENKGLTIDFEIGSLTGENFRGDAGRLRQILGNIVSNAVKFTETGRIELKVSLLQAKEDANVLLFEIIDTGLGIGEAQKARLFQPFMQADFSTTRRFGGTGLGLAICKELVGLMNGVIGVESEPGEGSRFWFTVELSGGSSPRQIEPEEVYTAEDDADIHTTFDSFIVGLTNAGYEGLNILFAEDNEISREIILKLLSRIGCRIQTAKNGLEAVQMALKGNFDLILMDCQMPELDGYAATEMIRRHETPTHQATIIALSAHAEELEREKCLRAGMDDFLPKPLTKESLKQMLEKYFLHRKDLSNLDLEGDLGQHSLAEIITPEILENFSIIESRGETGFLAEIFQIYFENTGRELKELKTDIQNNHRDSVRRRAHRLKGSSANAGLKDLTLLFERLEKSSLSEKTSSIENLITEIEQNFDIIEEKISKTLFEKPED